MMTHDEQLDRWLQMELDGELEAADARALAAADPEAVAAARREWTSFGRLLESDRIDVGPEFRERVLCALAEPSWAARSRLGWGVPVVMALVFALSGGLLLAGSDAFGGPLSGTALALADFFQASLLVGAGMLAASWDGVARNLGELIASTSGAGLVALGLLVLALNGLLIALLRRRRVPHEVEAD